MSNSRIVVVGSSNTDMIVQTAKLPQHGETVLGEDLVMAQGGKGANQAVAAVKVGGDVSFVARVGNDMFGRNTLDSFAAAGLDTEFVTKDAQAPSGAALCIIGPAGENILAVASGANRRLAPQHIADAAKVFEQAAIVQLQLEVPIETVLAAVQAGHKAGAKVILNPAPAPSEPLPDELLQGVDVITPNEIEAAMLSGKDTPEDAAKELISRGPETVIVTLGKTGALVATAESMERVPGFDVKAVDTTAAGDAFNGGLAVALARGDELPVAVRFAHAVAALSVMKLSAQPSLPTAEQVARFLDDHK